MTCSRSGCRAARGTHHVDLADRGHEIPSGIWRIDTLRLLFPGKPYSIALSWATPPDPS